MSPWWKREATHTQSAVAAVTTGDEPKEVAGRGAKVILHRAAGRRRAELQGPEQEREGEGQDIDEDEQPDDERDRSSPVRLDMRVEAERGHRRVPSASRT